MFLTNPWYPYLAEARTSADESDDAPVSCNLQREGGEQESGNHRQNNKMAASLHVDRAQSNAMNLQVLKRQDDAVTEIVDTASHVVMYEFDQDGQSWVSAILRALSPFPAAAPARAGVQHDDHNGC